MIVIQRKDKEKLADMVSEMLRIGGRVMSCIEEMEQNGEMGERRYQMRDGMGMRDGGSYGNRGNGYGNRDDYEPVMMYRVRRRY